MKKLFSIFLLSTMLFNQIALAQTTEEIKNDIDSSIEFQIKENHLINKILNTLPVNEVTMFDKLLVLNENQIKGYYSFENKAVKIESNIKNNNEIIKYLESKNLDFKEFCETEKANENNCILTSNKKVDNRYISLDDTGFYLHENELSKDMRDHKFSLDENKIARVNIESKNNPFEINIFDEGDNFGYNYTIELTDSQMSDYLAKKDSKLDYLDYITSSTVAFLENKGFDSTQNKKYENIIKNNIKDLCMLIDNECTDANELIEFTGNIYNLPENSILYELIEEKDSAAILDVNDNLEISYTYVFKDSKDYVSQLNKELKERLAVLGYIRYGDLGLDTYEIQGSVADVFKALQGDITREDRLIRRLQQTRFIDETNQSTSESTDESTEESTNVSIKTQEKSISEQYQEARMNFNLFKDIADNTIRQKSYLKVIESEENSDLIVTVSLDPEFKKEKTNNSEIKTGLSYYELNINPYLDALYQNIESVDPLVATFGNFLRDIKLTGGIETKDNIYTEQGSLQIPETTISTLLGFLSMGSSEETQTEEIYSDMTKEDWYYDDVNNLAEQISLDLILDTQMDYETFQISIEPSKEITRREFILMITDLLYSEEVYELNIQHLQQLEQEQNNIETTEVLSKEDFFVDYNDPDQLGFYNIMYAKKIGLVKGDEGKNTLRPNDSLSRAEAITLLARSFDSLKDAQIQDVELEFEDVPSDAWYMENLKRAVKNNVVKGTSKTTFSPTQKLNRAGAITLLNRLNKQILKLY